MFIGVLSLGGIAAGFARFIEGHQRRLPIAEKKPEIL
jgi:hypothetical protein